MVLMAERRRKGEREMGGGCLNTQVTLTDKQESECN